MTDSLSQVVTNFLDEDTINDRCQAATLFYQACLLGQFEGLDCVKRLLAAGYSPSIWPDNIHYHNGRSYSREFYISLCLGVAVVSSAKPANLALVKLILSELGSFGSFEPFGYFKTDILLNCDHGCGRDEIMEVNPDYYIWRPPLCEHSLNLSLVKLLIQYGFDDRWAGAMKLAIQRQDLALIYLLVVRDEIFIDDNPNAVVYYDGVSPIRYHEFENLSLATVENIAILTLLRQYKLYRDWYDSYLIYLVQWWSPGINLDINRWVYRLKGKLYRVSGLPLTLIGHILVWTGLGVVVTLAVKGLIKLFT